MLHDPIIINVDTNEKLSEKVLKKYILKELEHFFLELGTGFSFVIVELKLDKSKYKDIHQLLLYRDMVDKTMKKDFHNKTIAILISKENDKFILEYVSDMDVLLSTYSFYNTINNK